MSGGPSLGRASPASSLLVLTVERRLHHDTRCRRGIGDVASAAVSSRNAVCVQGYLDVAVGGHRGVGLGPTGLLVLLELFVLVVDVRHRCLPMWPRTSAWPGSAPPSRRCRYRTAVPDPPGSACQASASTGPRPPDASPVAPSLVFTSVLSSCMRR